MGFLHQLQLLLWKNVTLKRRGPWVLAFEIFIPLVLFFILLGLRQKKPALPVKEAFYSSAPLTSAGIIPIMQSLCPDGQRDEFGFLQYQNSTVTQLLERISQVVQQNHLFAPDRPSLGQQLENLQQHLENLKSTPITQDRSFNHSQGEARSSSVSDYCCLSRSGSSFASRYGSICVPRSTLLTGSMLEALTCGVGGASELRDILLVSERQSPELLAYHGAACSGKRSQRSERFRQLSLELKDHLFPFLSVQLRQGQPEAVAPPPQTGLGALLKDVADVERLLKDVDLLSGLARLLPKGACSSRTPVSPASTSSPVNVTTGNPNATDTPGQAENPRSQFSAFVQLWAGLQPILCGNNRIIEPEALKQGNMSSLGFTSKEQRNLGLLVHLMTTNPKILYSPIGSQVDRVIQKANETFVLVGNVTHYTRVWLNISAQLRSFLEEGRLQQVGSALHELRGLRTSGRRVYSLPNTSTLLGQLDTIDNAACGWTRFMSKVSVDVFKGFPDEDSIVNYTLNQAFQDNVSVFASVVFQTNADGSLPPHVLYKIRQNSSFTEKTNEIRRAYWRPGPNTGGKFYFLYGFVWIQDMMERAIINTLVGHDVVEPGNYVQMFPYPCYTRDDFLFVIEHMMPLCMVISWVYSVAMMIQHIVAEKEHRLKEVMKMMGLNNAVHWVAWFITGFLQLSVSVTALTAILKYGRVLLHSDTFIIWLFLSIYAVATIMFCFLVSVIYSKAKLASACGGIIYFLSYVPYMYVAIREEVAHDKITAFEKCIASLMSTTAFGLGSKYFALYEVAGVGIQWRTISQSPVEGDDFNLGLSMMMLIVDAAAYGVLTWYIEAVHPEVLLVEQWAQSYQAECDGGGSGLCHGPAAVRYALTPPPLGEVLF
uniref:ATP-binding cassette, sub-family A (ABC1), member 2 n=1 Tax=Gouania willdenowi TaxID=441366 RepID=A0A8C5ESK9_GOUWI